MSLILLGLGLVLVIEGLVFALAPSRLEDLIAAIHALGQDQRRAMGLAAIGLGVLLIWVSQG